MAGRHRGRACRTVGLIKASSAVAAFGAVLALAVVTGGGAAASTPPTLSADPAFAGGHPEALDFPFPAPCTKSTSAYATATAIARQSDGKILVGGYSVFGTGAQFDVARVNPDGSLDTSFGPSGTGYVAVQPAACGDYQLHGLAIQSDGKIVLAGGNGAGHVVLVRLNANGTLDTANFGSGGVAEDTSATDTANGVALDSAGNILVAGSAGDIRAYRPSGVFDNSFGTPSVQTIHTGHTAQAMTSANAIRIQPDGKVVIVGYSTGGGNSHAVVARFTSDGQPDTSFGTGGVADITPTGGNEKLRSVTMDGNEILVGGSSGGGTANLLALLTSSGQLDPSFGTGGRATDPGGANGTSGLNAVGYVPGSQIVAGGTGGDAASSQHGTELCNYYLNGQPVQCEERPLGASYKGAFALTVASLPQGQVVNLAGTDGPLTSQELAKGGGGTTGPTGPSGSTGPTGPTGETCLDTNLPTPCADLGVDVYISGKGADIDAYGVGAIPLGGRDLRLGEQPRINFQLSNAGPNDSPGGSVSWQESGFAYPVFPSSSYACTGPISTVSSPCQMSPLRVKGPFVYLIFDPFFAGQGSAKALAPGSYSIRVQADGQLPDPHPKNNIVALSYYLYNQQGAITDRIPKTELTSQLDRFGGTLLNALSSKLASASILQEHLAALGRTRKVQIAVLELSHRVHVSRAASKTCRWLAGATASFVSTAPGHGTCDSQHWLTARGTTHWAYRLRRHLPRGKYVLYVRVIDGAGNPSVTFPAADGDRQQFTLT